MRRLFWNDRSGTITPSPHHPITPSPHHPITPSHHHTITPSHHHTITPSHHHTITPSHHHTITPSHHHPSPLHLPPGAEISIPRKRPFPGRAPHLHWRPPNIRLRELDCLRRSRRHRRATGDAPRAHALGAALGFARDRRGAVRGGGAGAARRAAEGELRGGAAVPSAAAAFGRAPFHPVHGRQLRHPLLLRPAGVSLRGAAAERTGRWRPPRSSGTRSPTTWGSPSSPAPPSATASTRGGG